MKRKRPSSSVAFAKQEQAVSLPNANDKVADITINGSEGEGGGQIVRIALPLAMLLSRSVRITDIRKGRANPGLRPQHLAGAQMVAQVASAGLFGGQVTSSSVFLEPGSPEEQVLPLTSTVGTAGATSLVLQAVLPVALKYLPGSSVHADQVTMQIRGGTCVPSSPTSDYVKFVLAPNLRHFGIQLKYDVIRHGFFPQGGGECSVIIDKSLCPLVQTEEGVSGRVLQSCTLTCRGNITSIKGSLIVRGDEYMQLGVADAMMQRVVQVVRKLTRNHEGYPSFDYSDIAVHQLSKLEAKDNSISLTLYASSSCGTVLGSSITWNPSMSLKSKGDRKERSSRKGRVMEQKYEMWRDTAAASGESAADELCDALASMAVVDTHMADQLGVFMVMSNGVSSLLVPEPSRHLSTAVHVMKQFGIGIDLEQTDNSNNWVLRCEGRNILLKDQ